MLRVCEVMYWNCAFFTVHIHTEEQAASNGSGSFTHWQLAVAGICSVLLAVGIVSLVFAVAYVDRKRRRDKQRRLELI